ncbi:hypothetical protein [Rhodoferax sp.]|uniref:hypothetical protein n=1 Tax=Rhodoferax sp. TaxID=50421 RepID=UPI002ACECDDB|nr:hypothetical protein [Rhodoferax sp.]MDZ7921385.1 hypothetical protein [Rhodoferax sp.]
MPVATVDAALAQLRPAPGHSLVAANPGDGLLRDGIPVEYDDAQGQKQRVRLRLIDFGPDGAQQTSSWRYRSCGQVHQLHSLADYRSPIALITASAVFVELKNSNVKLKRPTPTT